MRLVDEDQRQKVCGVEEADDVRDELPGEAREDVEKERHGVDV